MLQYYKKSYENMLLRIYPSCSKAAGHLVQQSIVILDMKGGGIGMATPKVYKFMKMASSITQDNFPETLYKLFIVNAPMLFNIIWKVCKTFIDKKT